MLTLYEMGGSNESFLTYTPLHLSSTMVQVLFTLNATAVLYYYLRTCRTDPGFIRVTEEKKKMVGKL